MTYILAQLAAEVALTVASGRPACSVSMQNLRFPFCWRYWRRRTYGVVGETLFQHKSAVSVLTVQLVRVSDAATTCPPP